MKVIITGTSQGIGQAIVKKFLKMNHQVIGIDRMDCTIEHSNYHHYKEDILYGNLPEINDCDILINNAGVQNENDIDINLKGTIRVTEKYAFSS